MYNFFDEGDGALKLTLYSNYNSLEPMIAMMVSRLSKTPLYTQPTQIHIEMLERHRSGRASKYVSQKGNLVLSIIIQDEW